jgi:hypothetical protein
VSGNEQSSFFSEFDRNLLNFGSKARDDERAIYSVGVARGYCVGLFGF